MRQSLTAVSVALLLWIVVNAFKIGLQGTKRDGVDSGDIELMRDARRATPELAKRLKDAVNVQDGLLLIRDPIIGDLALVVMPARSFWVLRCGFGVTVAFGGGSAPAEIIASPEGQSEYASGSAAAGAELTLTDELVDSRTCAALGPALGKVIEATLGKR
jgi:hypothetical protein